jgi:hypothetical protein
MRVRRTRVFACVTLTVGLLSVGGDATAAADATTLGQSAAKRVSITGATQTGERFQGTYRIERVVRASDGSVYAVADLRGRMGGRDVVRRNVHVAAALAQPAQTAQIPPTPGACQVLNLTLGPLDLTLLGLRIRLSRVDLRIEAIPGGGLLGDLLCAIAARGETASGARFRGTFGLQRFTAHAGQLYAVGKLRGRVAGRRVVRTVRLPTTVRSGTAHAAQIPPTPGACQVLNLTLGPLDLTLLGLRVRLSRVDLRIEAIPGGGLLGDLLCALSGGPMSALTAAPFAQALNQLLAMGVPQGRP